MGFVVAQQSFHRVTSVSLSPVLSGSGAGLVLGFLLSLLQNWENAPRISRASGGSPSLSVENGLESPGHDVCLPDGGLVL